MRGRDVILIVVVLAFVGALASLGFWFGSREQQLAATKAASDEALGLSDSEAPTLDQGEPPAASEAALENEAPAKTAMAESAAPTTDDLEIVASENSELVNVAPEIAGPAEPATVIDAARVEEAPSAEELGALIAMPGGEALQSPRALENASDAAAAELDGAGDMAATLQSEDDALRSALENPENGLFEQPAPPQGGDGMADSAVENTDDAPSFDLVRVERDGMTHVAGRAAPGASIAILVDGDVAAETKANAHGEFYVLIDPPVLNSRTVRLDIQATLLDGGALLSIEPVIVTLPSTPGETPLAVQAREDGLVVLSASEMDDATKVSIDTVTYGESGEVIIAGRGNPGETARVYLDNALSAETYVRPDGEWRVKLANEVAPAVYALRVDQLTTEGAISGRAETPFERQAVTEIVLAEGSVIVQPGNNLWRIADYIYGDGTRYTVIYKTNKDQIRNPNLIYPGQVLNLPAAARSE